MYIESIVSPMDCPLEKDSCWGCWGCEYCDHAGTDIDRGFLFIHCLYKEEEND